MVGASGLVIEPAAADKLGLPAFGELHVAGIAGRVPCQYRRASSLTVGPLTMARPLFMEMALGGLVRGAPGPVIGIIGCGRCAPPSLEIGSVYKARVMFGQCHRACEAAGNGNGG